MDNSGPADPHWWTTAVDRARSRPVAYPSARRGRTILTAAIASMPTCRGGSYGPFCVRRVSSPPWVPSSSSSWASPRSGPGRWCCAASVRAIGSGDSWRQHPRSAWPRHASSPAAPLATSPSGDGSTPRTSSRTMPTGRSCCDGPGSSSRPGSDWVTVDEHTTAVAFDVREGLDAIAIDHDALDAGLVVVPRESVGTAADAPDRVPGRHGARRAAAPPRRAGLLRRARRRAGRAGARLRATRPSG